MNYPEKKGLERTGNMWRMPEAVRAVSELIPKLSIKYTVLSPKITLNDLMLFLEKLQALRVNSESHGLRKCILLKTTLPNCIKSFQYNLTAQYLFIISATSTSL